MNDATGEPRPDARPAAHTGVPDAADDREIDLLLEAVYRRYGHDFRDYARATTRRRIRMFAEQVGARCIAALVPMLIRDEASFRDFLAQMSIPVTEMFRDPPFFQALRETVLPVLATYPYFKIWHAGCATGEEVYSTAIVLHEAGLYDRAHIYATDCNPRVLTAARAGIYEVDKVRRYTASYQRAGGTASFSDYYHARYRSAVMRAELRRNVTFARHNLVTDHVFSEVHLVVCRNVLIYFNGALRDRVLSLFADSLCRRGWLCLGSGESLGGAAASARFDAVSRRQRIFRHRA